MDKFKCNQCGKIFDEFEANYKFMAEEGKELCQECINLLKEEKIDKTDYYAAGGN